MELLGVRARMKANKRDRLDIMLLSVGIWSGIVLALLALEMKGLYEFIGMGAVSLSSCVIGYFIYLRQKGKRSSAAQEVLEKQKKEEEKQRKERKESLDHGATAKKAKTLATDKAGPQENEQEASVEESQRSTSTNGSSPRGCKSLTASSDGSSSSEGLQEAESPRGTRAGGVLGMPKKGVRMGLGVGKKGYSFATGMVGLNSKSREKEAAAKKAELDEARRSSEAIIDLPSRKKPSMASSSSCPDLKKEAEEKETNNEGAKPRFYDGKQGSVAALLPEEKRKELEKHIVKKKLATHLSQVQQNQSAGQLTPSQSDGNIAALQTQDRRGQLSHSHDGSSHSLVGKGGNFVKGSLNVVTLGVVGGKKKKKESKIDSIADKNEIRKLDKLDPGQQKLEMARFRVSMLMTGDIDQDALDTTEENTSPNVSDSEDHASSGSFEDSPVQSRLSRSASAVQTPEEKTKMSTPNSTLRREESGGIVSSTMKAGRGAVGLGLSSGAKAANIITFGTIGKKKTKSGSNESSPSSSRSSSSEVELSNPPERRRTSIDDSGTRPKQDAKDDGKVLKRSVSERMAKMPADMFGKKGKDKEKMKQQKEREKEAKKKERMDRKEQRKEQKSKKKEADEKNEEKKKRSTLSKKLKL